jgi:hypothetical protein
MPTNYDADFDWNKLETGLPDNFTATITNPEFTTAPEVNDGDVPFMQFSLIGTDEDGEPYEGDARLKAGKGWDIEDNGRSVVRSDGKSKSFHENSGLGTAMRLLRDSGVDFSALVREKKMIPTEVGFWEGMTFLWKRHEDDFGGEIGVVARLMPVELVAGSEGKAGGAAKAAPAKAAAKKAPAKAAKDEGGVSAELRQRIYDIAYAAADHPSYVEQCVVEIDEASSDAAVLELIEAEDEDSIWGRAVADWTAANQG